MILTQKSAHNELRDRIADEYRQKGYCVVTEKIIGHRRVDVYAENDQEVLIIEVVDSHYSGLLDGKFLHQIKLRKKNPLPRLVHRKVWKPSSSKTLVVSIPEVPFLKEGDKVKVMATSKQRIVIEKEE